MTSEWIDPELSAEEDAEVKRKRREQSDRQSRKLGEKLLQGWCMLEETCPAGCLVPLMRSRQGREYCVSCELYVEEIEEKMQAAKQQAAQQQAKPVVQDLEEVSEPRCQIEHTDEHAAAPAAAQQTTTTSTTETVASSSSFSSFPMPVHFPSPAAQPESLVHPVHPFPNTTGLAPPQHDHHHHHHDQHHPHHHEQPHHHHHEQHHHHHQHQLAHGHVEAALATLYNKMEETRQRLAATPAAQCAPLVGVIAECARAIEALHSLSNGL